MGKADVMMTTISRETKSSMTTQWLEEKQEAVDIADKLGHGVELIQAYADIDEPKRRRLFFLGIVAFFFCIIWFMSKKKMNQAAHSKNGNTGKIGKMWVNMTRVFMYLKLFVGSTLKWANFKKRKAVRTLNQHQLQSLVAGVHVVESISIQKLRCRF